MSLVPSLLQAIVRVDGEALVMHAGDKPYVVSPTGQVELANRGLTLDAVSGIVNQMLPAEMQAALSEFGAIQYELPAMPEFPGEHFTVVAARGGDDLWVEIRRQRVADDDLVPDEMFTPSAAAVAAVAAAPVAAPPVAAAPVAAAPLPAVAQAAVAQAAAETQQPVIEVRAAEAPVAKSPWQAKPLPPLPATPMADEMTEADLSASLDENDDLHLPDASQLWPARRPLRGEEPVRESDEVEID